MSNQVNKEVFRGFEVFDIFNAIKKRRDVVQLGGFEEGFKEEVIGVRCRGGVVGCKGVYKKRDRVWCGIHKRFYEGLHGFFLVGSFMALGM